MTRARPILFSTPMVRAILAGEKTVTRRVLAAQPETADGGRWSLCVASTTRSDRGMWSYRAPDPEGYVFTERGRERELAQVPCPYGGAGDRLWVRETFAEYEPDDVQGTRTYYRADYANGECQVWPGRFLKWAPSIFMPRDCSRITLDVVSVRVERLCSLDDSDAIREGIPAAGDVRPFARFAELWDAINGKRAPWASDPWVWRIEFKRAEVSRG